MATQIGIRIMERRQQLGLTQEELAFRMGYKTKSAINKIELGINDVAQSKVVKFAEALNTSVAYLMGWDETEGRGELGSKIDFATDVLIRMESDADFRELVRILYQLDAKKITGLKTLLDSFAK